MRSLLPLLTVPLLASAGHSAPSVGWNFVQNGTTGVVALETIVVSPTLALLFDRVDNNSFTDANGFGAWGAIWNFETNKVIPLTLVSNSFCASGGFLSNGTLVSVGGMSVEYPGVEPDTDGRMLIRLFEPCTDPTGVTCKVIEDPNTLHLTTTRWYPSSLRIYDGSLMVLGGIHDLTRFYNTDPVNSFEFFPPKDNGIARPSPFLVRSLPANLFPRAFALPDGRIFISANNRTIIYDVATDTETLLPDIPNGVRITNPFDGTATLLPLRPPLYTPEILVCGGSNASDTIPSLELSAEDPASDQCSRIVVTPAGIKKGWILERMPEARMMPEMVLMPDGKILIINGAETGYAAIGTVGHAVDGQSNANHAVLTPVMYDPDAPLGKRFSKKGLPTSKIARLYHSTATLTPSGNIFIAGSNPNQNPFLVFNNTFPTTYQAEYLNPPYMSVSRPALFNVPHKLAFNHAYTVTLNVPHNLKATKSNVQVALIDLGFSTHAFKQSSRLVFMNFVLAPNGKSITITTPPNNRVYPPGPAWIYITVDGVTSKGTPVLVGNGLPPPVQDQGVSLPHH